VYHKENGNIMRIKEVKCYHPYQTLSQQVNKSAIALFINEVLNKAVKDQTHTSEIFGFISNSMLLLDETSRPENFHLIFLLGLSRHLGFAPNQADEVLGVHWLDEPDEKLLNQLLRMNYQSEFALTYAQRQTLLNCLIRFYQTHIDGFGEIKSLPVLQEVLR
jgi:DNA repair protein RecO (recombination protein O)